MSRRRHPRSPRLTSWQGMAAEESRIQNLKRLERHAKQAGSAVGLRSVSLRQTAVLPLPIKYKRYVRSDNLMVSSGLPQEEVVAHLRCF